MTYLYGPSGCGKSHLLHAFATEFAKLNPSKNVKCLSAEKFAFEYRKSVKENNTIGFKQSIRNNDLLIIEDLQYIITNKASQIELMHTINHIVEKNGKVIISSNVSPFLIEGINKDLITRTSFGLLIDIQTADKELKEKFIENKAEELNFHISSEIVDYLATNFKRSLRELSGAISRIFNYSFLSGNDISISFLNNLLKDMFVDFGSKIEISDIKKEVAKHYNLLTSELSNVTKVKKIAMPRQIAMYLCKTLTNKSLTEIGTAFGGKNHSTIIHSIKKIEKLMDENNSFAKEVNLLKSRF
jgi:chromosomal replication initiator protein